MFSSENLISKATSIDLIIVLSSNPIRWIWGNSMIKVDKQNARNQWCQPRLTVQGHRPQLLRFRLLRTSPGVLLGFAWVGEFDNMALFNEALIFQPLHTDAFYKATYQPCQPILAVNSLLFVDQATVFKSPEMSRLALNPKKAENRVACLQSGGSYSRVNHILCLVSEKRINMPFIMLWISQILRIPRSSHALLPQPPQQPSPASRSKSNSSVAVRTVSTWNR